MKLSIFGKHPIPQGGFNGVMSLFEAIEFSRLGYETSLLIPFKNHAEFNSFLELHKLKSLNELPRFGGRFSIIPIFPNGENFDNCDVLVYQSYFPEDWENFAGLCRAKSRLMTKNFPKFVPSADSVLESHVVGQFKQFDLVACALLEDVQLLASHLGFAKQYAGSFIYSPRGASPELLHPGYKAGLPPTIGLDVPNNPELIALAHYFEPITRLKQEIPDLRVISVGRDVPQIGDQKVPFGRFDRIFEQFFNRIHVYCTINYEYSPDHLKARVQAEASNWRRKAIYEVQNIEAQMSGAVLFGHRDNLISELYQPGISGLNFTDFSSTDEIYRGLKHVIENRFTMGRDARLFAEAHFSWSHCIRLWSDGICAKMKAMDGTSQQASTTHEDKSVGEIIETSADLKVNTGFDKVSEIPAMEPTGIKVLKQCLSASQVYLEYGAGGSTLLAGQMGVQNIISVESDKKFLDSIVAKCNARHYEFIPCHVDIGPTKEWGHPVDKTAADQWPNYCIRPWIVAADCQANPDLVLIDGRFRVACFLATLIYAKPNTIILFDDYMDRTHYHVVEKYCQRVADHGRLAQFVVPESVVVRELIVDLLRYATNPA